MTVRVVQILNYLRIFISSYFIIFAKKTKTKTTFYHKKNI